MAYKKRGQSPVVETALNRQQGILQTYPAFDFGNGLNNDTYQELIDMVTKGIHAYNGLLTSADAMASQIDIDEKALADFSSRALNMVGSLQGYDSIPYEQAGGVRTSDIKHSGGNKKPTTK